MTTVARTGASDQMHAELAALRDQMKSTRVLAGFLLTLSVVAGGVLVFTLLAGTAFAPFLSAPSARWAALGLMAAAGAAVFAASVVRPLFWKPTYASLARIAEERIEGLDNAFIIAVQLAAQRRSDSPYLLFRAIEECLGRARGFDILAAVDRGALRRRGLAACAVGACLLAYMVIEPARFSAGMAMLLTPDRFVPSVGAAPIAYVRPGNIEFVRGVEMTIEAGIAAPVGFVPSAHVIISESGGRVLRRELKAISPTQFVASIGPAQLPFRYHVEIAGTQSRWYDVRVVERPAVRSVDVYYEYPEYTRMGRRHMANASGDIAAPYGTRVTIEVDPTRPVASGRLEFDTEPLDLLPAGSGERWTASFTVVRDGFYRISLCDAAGNAAESTVPHAVNVVRDQPPTVTMPQPGRDFSAAAGSRVPLLVEVADDYGIAAVEIVVEEQGGEARLLRRWADVGTAAAALPMTLHLAAPDFNVGVTYMLYARATDNNPLTGPGEGRSQAYAVTVIDSAQTRAELAAEIEGWIERLWRILAVQETARDRMRALAEGAAAGSPLFDAMADTCEAQMAIRSDTAAIATEMTAGREALFDVRRALETLVDGDMAAVVAACDRALRARQIAMSEVEGVVALQEHIVGALRRILGVAVALLEEARAAQLGEAGEVPSEAQEKLTRLLEDLKRFSEDQRRIIEATSNLAAIPVDDYTDETLRRIDELRAAEENWSAFLKEAWSDLSRLPVQDFSNPSVLRDLVETFSEIEMAAGALEMQAVSIAVMHEQVGLELAETLTTHLEKWLTDMPDRLKWVLEEPVTDIDVPMAELPTDLQDIIGDLLEQEEDLMDDIEDVSSSWADSIDKDAGWDALDGPISNMSAQGVTGNILPNSSEIGGRSGEGRTGRASGEFVGDSAVGKGGRRTPTRVTPDAFLAGDIDDTSAEAAAGATGGGKASGAGEEGLHGPVPRELARDIARLAQRQSQIISQTQKVNIALRLAGYPNAQMEAALALMEDVERDVRTGQLGNAIRRRQVLARSLKGAEDVVSRDIIINRDGTLVLPGTLRDEIMDGVGGRAPRGYDRLLKGYYESLSVER